MGAGQSGGVEIGGSSMGYQVLRVYPNSPGSRAGLKAYFDFIIAIGNTRFNKENGSLREILKASIDQKLKMVVFNTRIRQTREVEIVPSTSWGGNGLLGVSIKHSSFDRADERVWHILEVQPGSPAQQAGFIPEQDYVIGSDSILQENDDLYNLIETHEGKALKLFVYNAVNDNCREVICHPNSKWGGQGYLGCEFGHGRLHRIPYDEKGDQVFRDNSKAPLLRNERPMGGQSPPQNNNNSPYTFQSQLAPQINNSPSFQNQLMQCQIEQLQRSNQPGQQLFQRALFDHKPPAPEPQESRDAQQSVPQQQQQIPQQQQLQQQYHEQQPQVQQFQHEQQQELLQQQNQQLMEQRILLEQQQLQQQYQEQQPQVQQFQHEQQQELLQQQNQQLMEQRILLEQQQLQQQYQGQQPQVQQFQHEQQQELLQQNQNQQLMEQRILLEQQQQQLRQQFQEQQHQNLLIQEQQPAHNPIKQEPIQQHQLLLPPPLPPQLSSQLPPPPPPPTVWKPTT